MKTRFNFFAILACSALLLAGCNKGYDVGFKEFYGARDGGETQGGGQQAQAGVLTAGEWNDLEHWDFWGNLLNNKEFSGYETYWSTYTDNRVAVEVTGRDGRPVVGVEVALSRGGTTLWTTLSDNRGRAECWAGLFQRDSSIVTDSSCWEEFAISIGGALQDGKPVFSRRGYPASINTYTFGSLSASKETADIAFIVDATGSMSDEIAFLKQDLMSILETVKDGSAVALRTGTVFYRDKGDEYVTRFSPLTKDIASTIDFISQQNANGGGDYEEAVHTALAESLQSLAWDERARARLAFLVFDAPAHQNHAGVVESLQKSVQEYATKGIKLIPVLASGGSKEAEFMGRLFAIATNGTYVFLTDDSGVGNEHIEASVGEYEVEKLHDLLVRLILENIR